MQSDALLRSDALRRLRKTVVRHQYAEIGADVIDQPGELMHMPHGEFALRELCIDDCGNRTDQVSRERPSHERVDLTLDATASTEYSDIVCDRGVIAGNSSSPLRDPLLVLEPVSRYGHADQDTPAAGPPP